MIRRRATGRSALASTFLAFLAGSCGAAPPSTTDRPEVVSPRACGSASDAAERRWVQSDLYFARTRRPAAAGGGERAISDQEWAQFLSDVVTSCFPAGLSTWDVSGQYRTLAGEIRRDLPTSIVRVLHPPDDASQACLDLIRRTYCERFDQESVMQTQTCADVAF